MAVVLTPLMSAAYSAGTAFVRCAITALNWIPNPRPPTPNIGTRSASLWRPLNSAALIAT
jgi:hypothetical protein